MDVPRTGRGRGQAAARWELYRLLADPVRLRLLGLASAEELAVSELAELLGEGMPKVSRHAAALRDAGLISARRQGTWSLLRLAPSAAEDPVVADAVRAGLGLASADGTLFRVEAVVAARDGATREFFARAGRSARVGPPAEFGAYLAALAPLLPARALAVDVGTGDGALLEVLAPLFERVVGLDRSEAQLGLASARIARRSLDNVELVRGEVDGPELAAALDRLGTGRARGADVVFASRVLHHAPVPAKALRALAGVARPPGEREGARELGGAVCVLEYEAHDDESMREREADLWLGFDASELRAMAEAAGLEGITIRRLPGALCGDGPDRHLAWHALVGRRAGEDSPSVREERERT